MSLETARGQTAENNPTPVGSSFFTEMINCTLSLYGKDIPIIPQISRKSNGVPNRPPFFMSGGVQIGKPEPNKEPSYTQLCTGVVTNGRD